MFKKSLMAAAIVAVTASPAYAVLDLDAESGAVIVATESYGAADLTMGYLDLDNGATDDLYNVAAQIGFTIAQGTSKYVRISLANARFGTSVNSNSLTTNGAGSATGTGTFSAQLSQGGAAGDDFVIFEVTDSANDIALTDVVTLALGNGGTAGGQAGDSVLESLAGNAATVTFEVYESAADAVNQITSNRLVNKTYEFLTYDSANNGEFVEAVGAVQADVAKDFKEFVAGDGVDAGLTVATLGLINAENALVNDTINPLGIAVTTADIFDLDQTLRITGDFSNGAWGYATGAAPDCSAPTDFTVETDTSLTLANFNVTTAPLSLCLTVDGTTDVIEKNVTPPIKAELVDETFGALDLATVTYNSTTIIVPYVTTFDGYNQRVYIVNKGTTDAEYSSSFVSEAEATATAGSAATGTVPANEMVTIRASDLVTLEGRTRTSAEIEIEAPLSAIEATTQTVNLSDGSTDTVVLEVCQGC